ncbi:hypothetical protein Tco_0565368 [Tanacetum coccineum]
MNPLLAFPDIFSPTTCRRRILSPGTCRWGKRAYILGDIGIVVLDSTGSPLFMIHGDLSCANPPLRRDHCDNILPACLQSNHGWSKAMWNSILEWLSPYPLQNKPP